MRDCSTGKICHMSQEVAEEALVENRARNNFDHAAGPINIYKCEICHYFHFTSKGNPREMLSDPVVQRKIERMKIQNHWERKFNL